MIKRPVKFGLMFLCAGILSLFVATCCNNEEPPCRIPSFSQAESYEPPSPNLVTDIYFDATVSMRGFISEKDSETHYQKITKVLQNYTLINNGNRVIFHKFGERIEEVSTDKHDEVRNLIFYNDKQINQKTKIEKVIEQIKEDRLTIIVTDLFQENSNSAILNKNINEYVINKKLAFGILGIKSQFKGTIYDVYDKKFYDYPKEENKNEDFFRPFYLLAFGKHADLTQYFNYIIENEISSSLEKKNQISPDLANQLIISKYLTESSLPAPVISDLKAIKGLNNVPGEVVSNNTPNKNYKEFRVIRDAESSYFEIEIPFNRMLNTADPKKIIAKWVSCDHCPDSPALTDSNYPSAVEIEVLETDESSAPEKTSIKNKEVIQHKTKLKVTVFPTKLKAKANCFRVSLYASTKLPEWVDEWDMPEKFDGSKTIYFRTFLQTILDATIGIESNFKDERKVADFYFYVKNT